MKSAMRPPTVKKLCIPGLEVDPIIDSPDAVVCDIDKLGSIIAWIFKNKAHSEVVISLNFLRHLLLSSAKNNQISLIGFCENYLGHKEDCHVTVEKVRHFHLRKE